MVAIMNSPEEVLQKLSEEAQDRIKAYKSLRDDIALMSSTAESDDGSVAVTIAPGGAVTDITLTDRALRHGAERLSQLLMSTIATASRDIAERMAARVQETVPPGSGLDVVGMVESRLPELNGEARP